MSSGSEVSKLFDNESEVSLVKLMNCLFSKLFNLFPDRSSVRRSLHLLKASLFYYELKFYFIFPLKKPNFDFNIKVLRKVLKTFSMKKRFKNLPKLYLQPNKKRFFYSI